MALSAAQRLSREENRQRTRELLRKSAAACFARNGFEGTSVDQISEGAGFSRGAFYSNFADKEAIFLELLQRHLDRDVERFRRAAADSQTLPQLMDAIAASYRDLGANPDWCLLSSEFQLYASRTGKDNSAFAEAYTDYRARLTGLLKPAFEKFDIRSDMTASELVSALIGLSHGLALERASSGTNLPMEVTGKAIRALIFGASRSARGDDGEKA